MIDCLNGHGQNLLSIKRFFKLSGCWDAVVQSQVVSQSIVYVDVLINIGDIKQFSFQPISSLITWIPINTCHILQEKR